MTLRLLLPLIEDMPTYRQLVADLKQARSARVAMLDAAKSYLIAALYSSLGVPLLVITAQPENAKKLYEQLLTWEPSLQFKLLPQPDALPYQRIASDASTMLERIQALSALANSQRTADTPLVVASAPALMTKTAQFDNVMSTYHSIELGMVIDPFNLLHRWEAMGYRMEHTVTIPGTMSHRGGIIDIYPPTSDHPVRLEFFGNTIDSIRLFDPVSQRSQDKITSVAIGAATEMLTLFSSDRSQLESISNGLDLSGLRPEVRQQFEQDLAQLGNKQPPDNMLFYAPLFNHDSILTYLSPHALLILDEPALVKQLVQNLDAEASELRREKTASGELPANFPRPYFTWEELEMRMQNQQHLMLTTWSITDSEAPLHLDFSPAPSYAGQLPVFISEARELLRNQKRIIVVSNQASRLSELLAETDIIAPAHDEVRETPPPGTLTLVHGSLADGWIMNNDTHLYIDADLFGFVKQRRLTRKRPVSHRILIDMAPGDYVVHVEHGIGRFAGVTTMRTDSTEKEYLVLKYALGDRLYVPTDQIDRVSRYIGATDKPPALSRLGSQEWLKTRQKVKEAAVDVARELLALYASREVMPGFAFSPDTVWQQELEASFPYIETPDQVAVQREVKADMEKPRPMDRLICGDVGYGKTEIAVRAAFKSVMDNRQVAVLVPTTVLAQQHFATFSQRLSAFPVRVEVLSRFRTPKDQQTIAKELAEGRIDICIGTHRLLQKDVSFKNLGLVIIDEEQRFGVIHKEHLKKMRQEVDILTLSATPIPRTLHMALAGVRDMSTIETPPEDRLPIKTFVAEYDDRLVREAILREMERNGQVFFLHNRVQGINFIASKLRSLVPEARIAIAHGRVREAELAQVMVDFAQHQSDVLVCTTIIESGLDLPNVNTMIINRADRLGLTQLYQLRGRVGRGAELAHTYLLYDREKRLTPTAEKRLRTIYEAAQLGAGFNIAMKDLEIRGAGTLLGVKQSGHISAVGFTLYTELLSEAVEELKAKQAGRVEKVTKPLPEPSIDLPLPAYIPEDYVPDLNTRLALYQRLAQATTPEAVDAFAREFSDRFGTLSPEVTNLLYALRIKVLAAKTGIESISTEQGQIVVKLFEGMRFDRQKLEPLLKYGIKLGTSQLRLSPKRLHWQRLLEEVVGRVE